MRAFFERLRPFAPLPLRLALAVLLCVYGYKLVTRDLASYQAQILAWHLPKWVAPAGAWSALVGGTLLGLGFLTRLAGFGCALFPAAILLRANLHSPIDGGIDRAVLILAGCIALFLSGAGRFSLDRKFFG